MNLPAIQYYPLKELSDPFIIVNISQAVRDKLDECNINAIINAFYINTKICSNGIPYIKVKGISEIIRTGNSGLERALIYQGLDGVLPRAEIVSIDGFDHISGHHLCALLDARIATRRGNTKQYLKIAFDIYLQIVNSGCVLDIKELFLEEIEKCRPALKNQRINERNIVACEFTGVEYKSTSEVQFAHIDSVVYNPNRALDIDNGVIIFKKIHTEMTRLGINSYEETYEFCVNNNYSLAWA